MKKIITYPIAAIIIVLAIYGAFKLVSGLLTKSHGVSAAEAVHPFVQGAAATAAEKLKETLKETPDEKLERDAEFLTKKFYPIAKGIIKGQLEAIMQDTNRAEVPEKMYQAGKEFSQKVLKPFSEGLFEESQKTLREMDKSLEEVRKFGEKNKEVLDAIAKGLGSIQKGLRETLPPPPPGLPPFPHRPYPHTESIPPALPE